MTWAEQELGAAELGDARLSRRLVKLATRLAESSSASIPQACRGWAEMRAAYRFLAQDQLDWQDILQPHWDATAQRMREHPVVLCRRSTLSAMPWSKESSCITKNSDWLHEMGDIYLDARR